MRKFKGLLIIFLMIAFAVIYYVVIAPTCPTIAPLLMGVFMVCMAYLAYYMYGMPKFENTAIQVTLIRLSIIMMVIYFVLIYLLSAFEGYDKQTVSIAVLIPIVSIVATEILRYIVIGSNRDTGFYPYLITFSIMVLQIVTVVRFSDFTNAYQTVFILVTVIAPIIMRNLLLTAYCHHIDLGLTIAYAVLVTQYMNFMPVVPKSDIYTTTVAGILISFLALVAVYRLVGKNYEGYTMITMKEALSFLDFVIFLICASLGIMISRATPIQMFVEISEPQYVDGVKRGDGPVVFKGMNEFNLEEGDTFLYMNHDGTLQIMGVNELKVIESIDNTIPTVREVYSIIDGEKVKINNKKIYGKVLFNVKYIFIPALYIQDHIGGGK